MTGGPIHRSAVSARRTGAALIAGLAIAIAVLSYEPVPGPLRDFSRDIPRIFSELENVVARERMTQAIFDSTSDRIFRRRVIVSDYQIAHLEEDPEALWEFRFVNEVDGKAVAGAGQQIENFLRLRHRDAREERQRITNLGLAASLPGCYWHNLTLVLRAFQGDNVENFSWRRSRDLWLFEQVRGLGIPQDLFDPGSPRHYPRGSVAFSEGSLSHLDLEWTANGIVTTISLEFARPQSPDDVPLPKKYVARRRAASSRRIAVETTFEYGDYRHFRVRTESETKSPGSQP
jgi:hypothetical protein